MGGDLFTGKLMLQRGVTKSGKKEKKRKPFQIYEN